MITSGDIPSTMVALVVKQEPMTPYLTENSDVQCMGTMVEQEIVIDDDSPDPDQSMIQALQDEENPNPFLKLINADTQPEAGTSNSVDHDYSTDTLETLRPLESRSARYLRQDKEQQRKRNSNGALKESTNSRVGSANNKRRSVDRACPKSKKIAPGNIEYIDEDPPLTDPGNASHPPAERLSEILNSDFSVFLSSQLTDAHVGADESASDESKNEVNPFTIVPTPSATSIPSTCFTAHLHRVIFEKQKTFLLYVDLHQFSMYRIFISGASIQAFLNISDADYSSILQLLNMAEKYEFTIGETRRGASDVNFIISQLDIFFSTLIRFKTFQIIVNDETITCVDGNVGAITNGDLTASVDQEILRCISAFH